MNRRERAQRNVEDRIYRLTVGGASDSRWQHWVNVLTERGYAIGEIRRRLGLSAPLDTEDRRVLEEVIFPFYQNDPGFRSVLFVGCAVFTSHYQRKFFSNQEFWTIEPNPDQARFGSTRHLVAPLEDLSQHVSPGYFDVIFCNGVYGWGLDALAQAEIAFAQCHTCLREGGHLIFGWNDVPERTPFPLDDITNRNAFKRFPFPPLQSWRYLTNTKHRHVFDFYQK